jgi:hypothetical protein
LRGMMLSWMSRCFLNFFQHQKRSELQNTQPFAVNCPSVFFCSIFNQKGSWLLNGIQDSQYAAFCTCHSGKMLGRNQI